MMFACPWVPWVDYACLGTFWFDCALLSVYRRSLPGSSTSNVRSYQWSLAGNRTKSSVCQGIVSAVAAAQTTFVKTPIIFQGD